MKIIVIDDSSGFCSQFSGISLPGYTLIGINPVGCKIFLEGKPCKTMSVADAIRGANVVFLDHNMPQKGDSLLAEWKEFGLITEEMRVVGCSTDKQPYLSEQLNPQEVVSARGLAKFLESKPSIG